MFKGFGIYSKVSEDDQRIRKKDSEYVPRIRKMFKGFEHLPNPDFSWILIEF